MYNSTLLCRDPKIAHLLLQAQYPVLGVDCYMPVIDVFSGSCKGNLRVVLAMGRSEQIASLQRTRDEEYNSLFHLMRPVHLLDHRPRSQRKVCIHFSYIVLKDFLCSCQKGNCRYIEPSKAIYRKRLIWLTLIFKCALIKILLVCLEKKEREKKKMKENLYHQNVNSHFKVSG